MTLNEIRKMVNKTLPKQDFYFILKDESGYFTMDRKKAIFDYADALLGVYRKETGKESVLSIPDNFRFDSLTLETMLRTGRYYAVYGYWENDDLSAYTVKKQADIIPFFFDNKEKNLNIIN